MRRAKSRTDMRKQQEEVTQFFNNKTISGILQSLLILDSILAEQIITINIQMKDRRHCLDLSSSPKINFKQIFE